MYSSTSSSTKRDIFKVPEPTLDEKIIYEKDISWARIRQLLKIYNKKKVFRSVTWANYFSDIFQGLETNVKEGCCRLKIEIIGDNKIVIEYDDELKTYVSKVEKKAESGTLYNILGVDSDATKDAIKKSYLKQSVKLHPDKHPGEEEYYTALFQELNAAYLILSDSEERERYDTTILPLESETKFEIILNSFTAIHEKVTTLFSNPCFKKATLSYVSKEFGRDRIAFAGGLERGLSISYKNFTKYQNILVILEEAKILEKTPNKLQCISTNRALTELVREYMSYGCQSEVLDELRHALANINEVCREYTKLLMKIEK
jgi:hypothetical protein